MYIFSFIYGLIAALGALVLQIIVDAILPFHILTPLSLGEMTALNATIAFLFFAFTEEAAKSIAVTKGMRTPPVPYRTYLHAVFVGIGFTAVEFAIIALTPYDTNPFASPAVLGDIIIHACSPILIATFFIMLQSWHWTLRNTSTLLIVTLLHTSYNILAYTGYSLTSIPQLLFLGTFVLGTLYAIIHTTYIYLKKTKG